MNYIYRTLLITTLVIILKGCLFTAKKILVDDIKRTYSVHLPAGYSDSKDPYPVLFLFHGNSSRGWHIKLYTGMNKTADKNGFIVVYPDASNKIWPFLDCDKVNADIRFVEKIITEINNKYNIDTSRIYMAGMSGGGFFLSFLAEAMPERIAAMCVVAGNKVEQDFMCIKDTAKISIPFMLIHGTSDKLYNMEKYVLSAEKTVDYWLDANKCDTIPNTFIIPDINTRDNTNVTRLEYKSDISKDVVFYKIENGGHHWPNARFDANLFVKFDLGELNKDFNTNQVIWDFLSNYSIENTNK
jgi:polyhydroxybutyrate depolymerase